MRRLALGERDGTAELAITEKTVFSSLKPQAESIAALDPESRIVGSEAIEMTTLERVLAVIDHDRRIFLKIDTQGYEQHVLAGAGVVIARVQAVQLELPIVHLYQKVWSFTEAIVYMEAAGFVIAQLRPVVYLPGTAALAEVDCVFRRANVPGHGTSTCDTAVNADVAPIVTPVVVADSK